MTDPAHDFIPPAALVGEITDQPPVVHPPDDWPELTDVPVMTNFDHTIDETIAARLKEGGYWAPHSAWDFYGAVWFDQGRWHELVKVHHRAVATYSAGSLRELMTTVNNAHGWR